MPTPESLALLLLLPASRVGVSAQHYCWPCPELHGVVGKWTTSASDAPNIYGWYFRYLNNVVEGSANTGDGSHSYWKAAWQTEVVEAWDVAPNVMALEVNECGTFIGDYVENVSNPMTQEEVELVAEGLRLPTGEIHECTCSLQGRAHIINGSVSKLDDWDAVAEVWGKNYTEGAKTKADADYTSAVSTMSPEEAAAYSLTKIFGLHAVGCPFHRSGPCKLTDIEDGVRRAWDIDANFSSGYVPLMDNNIMLWVASLGPLLDAFQRDGVPFYPLVWNASYFSHADNDTTVAEEMFSVVASPGGKVLVEVASGNSGGRGRELFNTVPHSRAVFDSDPSSSESISNAPLAGSPESEARPLSPLRISRAVGRNASLFQDMLEFYSTPALGFGGSQVLLDETLENGMWSL